MRRRDELDAEVVVLVARLIAGEKLVDVSNDSLAPEVLREAADCYERFLRTGSTS